MAPMIAAPDVDIRSTVVVCVLGLCSCSRYFRFYVLRIYESGMMDPAYFTSKKDLLEFFNDLLDLNLTKIEDTAPGAIACQLTNLIFPGSIPMSRVNWSARSDYEFIQNYKLLQVAFTKHKVQRYIDVDKLIRAKYQDNLEWCQWLKAFYEQSGSIPGPEYIPSALRERGKGGTLYNQKMGGGRRRSNAVTTGSSSSSNTGRSSNSHSRPMAAASTTSRGTTTLHGRPRATAPVVAAAATRLQNRPLRERVSNPPSAVPTPSPRGEDLSNNNNDEDHKPRLVMENKELKDQVQSLTLEVEVVDSKNSELTAHVQELELAVVETEGERDYYFDKLRNIEVLLQVFQERGHENDESTDKLIEDVFKLLYATKEENLVVNDDGEVVEQCETSLPLDLEDGGIGEEMVNEFVLDDVDNEIDDLLSDPV